MEKQSTPPLTIIAWGRTGVGKSSLGNKLAGGSDLFKEGHGQVSCTSKTMSRNFTWPLNKNIEVTYVDTPGFADNRAAVAEYDLLSDMLTFLQNIPGGYNVGLFCIEPKQRFDANDLDELENLQLLLGEEALERTWIVVTQVNRLGPDEKQKKIRTYPQELSELLKTHNFHFPPERILFADFDNFENQFLNPIFKVLMENNKSFKPKIFDQFDPNDPESVARFLQSPEMKAYRDQFEKKLADALEKTAESMKRLEEEAKKNAIMQKKLDKTEAKFEEQKKDLDHLKDKFRQEEKRNAKQIEDLEDKMRKLKRDTEERERKQNREHSWGGFTHSYRSGRGIFGEHWECTNPGCVCFNAAWLYKNIEEKPGCTRQCTKCKSWEFNPRSNCNG